MAVPSADPYINETFTMPGDYTRLIELITSAKSQQMKFISTADSRPGIEHVYFQSCAWAWMGIANLHWNRNAPISPCCTLYLEAWLASNTVQHAYSCTEQKRSTNSATQSTKQNRINFSEKFANPATNAGLLCGFDSSLIQSLWGWVLIRVNPGLPPELDRTWPERKRKRLCKTF